MPASDDDFDPRMTVGEHLEALRGHVIKAIIYIAAIAVVCFVFQKELMDWATWPHQRVQGQLVKESRVKDAPTELQSLVGEVDTNSRQLDKALARVGRQEAAARDKLEPTKDRLATLQKEQAELLTEAAALAKRADAVAAQEAPTLETIEALKRDREALTKKRAELRRRVLTAAGPFVDRHAKVPRFELTALSYQEPFLAYLKLAIVAAIFLGSPLVIFELWKFIGVGLYPHEKRHLKLFAPLSLVMFLLGGVFGYFLMIPVGLYFLATYAPPELVTGAFSMSSYLSLFITMTLVVGMVFQLPLIMSFLTLIGALNHKQFREYRGYAWLGGAILSAVLTPPDPVTQLMMLGPMGILYEIGVFSSMLIGDRRRQAEEEQAGTTASSSSSSSTKEEGKPAQLPGGPSSSADRAELLDDIEDPPGYDPDAEVPDDDDDDDPEIVIQPAQGSIAQGSLETPAAEEATDTEATEEDATDAGDPATEAAPTDADDAEPTDADDAAPTDADPTPAEEASTEEAPAESTFVPAPPPPERFTGDGDNDDPTLDEDEYDDEVVSDAPWRGPEAVDPEPDPPASPATPAPEPEAPPPADVDAGSDSPAAPTPDEPEDAATADDPDDRRPDAGQDPS